MTSDPALREALDEAAETYPYPIAAACRDVLDTEPRDSWHEWELLSRDALTPVLTYLSHLLLSDLVATGREPAHLFHRIEAILSRPLAGHYAGFLRETASYYREENVESAVPELIGFLLEAEVDRELTESGRPLLGELVDYRNRWAHGRIENEEVVENSLRRIRSLTGRLLEAIRFLSDLPLRLEDGTELMGSEPDLPAEPMPLLTVTAEDVSLRPLLLKLDGRELSVLAEADLAGRRLTYRSPDSYSQLSEEEGEAAERLFEELKSLLQEVRSLEATLPTPDLETFRERAAVQTNRMRTLYGKENLGKYDKGLYIQRPEWEAEGGHFWDFLESEKTLLAIDGEQGTGKSALAARLSERAEEAGHAVWFMNAQRFTFAEVSWSGNPFPRYFADRLSYEAPFDAEAIETLADEAEEGERIVLFVDGINEIGATSDKWNRFKAISQLLEWTEEVAHPKLKVVLTFRTEAYTRFDYLQPEDVPDRIEEISFQIRSSTDRNDISSEDKGKETKLPWVNTIDPFTEEQARELYDRLQDLERGMAPDMTWDEIQEGLGEELETFITNPLLFTIFLKAHEGESAVISTDQGELFTRYANGVTGARERQGWPWWKRAYHFLKNGNITDKERFLADCTEKASENGTPSFLVSDLEPDGSDRDERIAEFLADPEESEELEELQGSGLLVREPIYETGEDRAADQRVSFTSELLTQTMDRVSIAVASRRDLKNSIIIAGLGLLVMAGVFGAFLFSMLIKYSGELGATSYGLYTGVIGSAIRFIPLFLAGILWVIYPEEWIITKFKTPSIMGLLEYSIYEHLKLLVLSFLKKLYYFLILIIGFSIAFSMYMGISPGPYRIFYLSFCIVFILLFCYNPIFNNYFLRGHIPYPKKVISKIFSNIISSFKKYTETLNYKLFLAYLLASFILLFASSPLSQFHLMPYTNPPFKDMEEIVSIFNSQEIYRSFIGNYNIINNAHWLVFLFGLITTLFTTYLNHKANLFYIKTYSEKLYDSTYNIKYSYSIVFLLFILLISFAFSSQFSDPPSPRAIFTGQRSIEKVVAQHPALSSSINKPVTDNDEVHVSLQNVLPLHSSEVEALSSVPMTSLTLSSSQLQEFSLQEWAPIRRLTITGDSVQLQSDDAITSLEVLTVQGHLTNLQRVEDLYPTLSVLRVSEASIESAGGLPDLWDAAFIRIETENAPSLSWLGPESSSYIFEFTHPPTEQTKNLSIPRHAMFPSPALDPDILDKMENLRWLYLTNSPCGSENITSDKKDWCEELNRIESNRTLNIEHTSSKESLIKALLES